MSWPINKPKRVCGGCTACCTTHAIFELEKPMNTDCKYCAERSCAIYPSRPKSCQDFNCQWIEGWGENHDRPDRSGVVMDCFAKEGDFAPVVIFWEYRSGALSTPFVWESAACSLEADINVMFWHKSGTIDLYLSPGRKITERMGKVIKGSKITVKDFPILAQ